MRASARATAGAVAAGFLDLVHELGARLRESFSADRVQSAWRHISHRFVGAHFGLRLVPLPKHMVTSNGWAWSVMWLTGPKEVAEWRSGEVAKLRHAGLILGPFGHAQGRQAQDKSPVLHMPRPALT